MKIAQSRRPYSPLSAGLGGPVRLVAFAFAAALLYGPAVAYGACPTGAGAAVTIANLGANESVGHEYLLLKGNVAVGARSVTITRQAPGVPDEHFDWPADSGLFKGIARLRPGENHLVVSATGQAAACVDVAFERNPMPLHPMRATLVLTADQGEGPGVLIGAQSEATDLESARKRIGFALSLTQAVYADLMRRTTGRHWAPGVKWDVQGVPEVKVFRSHWTRDQLRNMGGGGSWAIDSVRREMGSLLEGNDMHAIFLLFFDNYKWNAPNGPWFAATKEFKSWPQGIEEMAARLTDKRPSGCNCGLGSIPMSTYLGEYYATFGQWLFLSAQQIRAYADDGNSSPLASLSRGLQLLMLRDLSTDSVKNNRLLQREDVFVNRGTQGAQEFLATGGFEKHLETYPARTVTGMVPGLSVAYSEGDFQALPDFQAKPLSETTVPGVVLPATARTEMFALRYTGWIKIPKTGAYRFHLSSDDGSRLYLDDSLVVDNDGAHTLVLKIAPAGLAAGYHAFRLDYFNRIGKGLLDLKWESLDFAPATVPESILFRTAPVSIVRRTRNASPPGLSRSGTSLIIRSARGQAATLGAYAPSGRREAVLFSGFQPAGETRLPAGAIKSGSLLILDAADGRALVNFP